MRSPLNEIRKRRGLTLTELSKVFNIDVGSLSRIERGKRRPSFETAELISRFFDGEITEMEILYPHKFIVTKEDFIHARRNRTQKGARNGN